MRVINPQPHISKQCVRVEYRKRIDQFQKDGQKNPTDAESRFREVLQNLDIAFEFQKLFNVGTKKRPKLKIVDFYLPQYEMVVEVDGGYHNKPKQKRRDFIREQQLIKKPGIANIVRFTNKEALNLSSEKIFKRIESY